MDEKELKLLRRMVYFGERARLLADQLEIAADWIKQQRERIEAARNECESNAVCIAGISVDSGAAEDDLRRAAARLRGEHPWKSKD